MPRPCRPLTGPLPPARSDADALGSRAVVLLALGRLAEANADWLRQLELLPQDRHDARACVWLRLASYEMALDELEPAVERSRGDPYLHLYYLTAARRLRVPIQPGSSAMDAWPGPLISLHEGKLDRRPRLCIGPTIRSVAPKPCSSLAYGPLAMTATRPAGRGGKLSRVQVRTRSNMQPRDTKSRSLARSRTSISFAPATQCGMITEATSG